MTSGEILTSSGDGSRLAPASWLEGDGNSKSSFLARCSLKDIFFFVKRVFGCRELKLTVSYVYLVYSALVNSASTSAWERRKLSTCYRQYLQCPLCFDCPKSTLKRDVFPYASPSSFSFPSSSMNVRMLGFVQSRMSNEAYLFAFFFVLVLLLVFVLFLLLLFGFFLSRL